jgi:predicted Zn-dependent protease
MSRARALVLLVVFAGCLSASKEDERRAGAEMAKQVETRIGVYVAPTQSWVSDVGHRLVNHLEPDKKDWDFQFEIVDQLEPNAFALPGGHIYVSRGLLALVVEEDDLACVLGHEITHVTERHAVKRARRAILPAILTLPGRIVGIVSPGLGDLAAAPFEVLGGLGLAKYSREQEEESDRLGAKLAANTGYDPRALARILKRLEKDVERLTGKENRKPSFFDSHPDTPTRVKDVDKEASGIAWTRRPPLRTWPEVLEALDGMPWGVNPEQGVFQGQLFIHPDLEFAMRFPTGWQTVNTPSAVGAVRGEEAEVVLTLVGEGVDPVVEGRNTTGRLRKNDLDVDDEHPIEVNGFPGYFAHVKNSDVEAHIVWVKMRNFTYRMVGVGERKDRSTIWGSIESFRPATEDELKSIDVVRIHPARAYAGETLTQLGVRTDNAWRPDYSALVNALPPGVVLEEGQAVKISRREPYVPRHYRTTGRGTDDSGLLR